MPLEVREADRQCRKAETQEVDCLVAFVGLLHLWAGVAGLNEPGILPPPSQLFVLKLVTVTTPVQATGRCDRHPGCLRSRSAC